jgi:hypothetical protein
VESYLAGLESASNDPASKKSDSTLLDRWLEHGVKQYRESAACETAARTWLAQEGFDEFVSSDLGVGIVARRKGEAIAIIEFGYPLRLNRIDTAAERAAELLGHGDFYRLVFSELHPGANLLERLKGAGIGFVSVDRASGDFKRVLEPVRTPF